MILDFIKLNPAENTTVLILNHVNPCYYRDVAQKIMAYSHLHAEQVGFITKPKNNEKTIARLEMAGGEFCGNGILAAGALCKYVGLTKNSGFKIESSGSDKVLECLVNEIKSRFYNVKSSMPLDYTLSEYKLYDEHKFLNGILVKLKGITHFLYETQTEESDWLLKRLVTKLAKELCGEAFGVIPYIRKKGDVFIRPCVFVPKTGSLVFERSCGSGSLALGLCMAHKIKSSLQLGIKQPGGCIKVTINGKKEKNRKEVFEVKQAFIETKVEITCEGKVFI